MRKISDAVRIIVRENPDLRFGLAQRLMNLSQVARYIHSAVEARTGKPVQTSAIAMSLSRLQMDLTGPTSTVRLTLARRITVQRGLAVATFPNTTRCQQALLPAQESIRASGGYVTITEGIREITVIAEEDDMATVQDAVPEQATLIRSRVASLAVGLSEANLATPAVLYRLLQPLAVQGINVEEVTSTTREFHIYIDESDVMLALDSMYGAYGGEPTRGV